VVSDDKYQQALAKLAGIQERLSLLTTEHEYEMDMVHSLLNHSAEDARYYRDAAAYRDSYHAGHVKDVCYWCGSAKDGPHAASCPEVMWPLERPSRRGRSGRPSRIMVRLQHGVLKGSPTCCGETFRCACLAGTGKGNWRCKLAPLVGWEPYDSVTLEYTDDGTPKRHERCLADEE